MRTLAGGEREEGLTILCLCQPHPGWFRHVLSSGVCGPVKYGWGPLTSERGLLRQEEEAMGQAPPGQPVVAELGGIPSHGLPWPCSWVPAWVGREGPLVCVLGGLTCIFRAAV